MTAIILSKKSLCTMFGLVSNSGKCNYPALRRLFITDEVMKDLGITEEQYKSMRLFYAKHSEKLVYHLGITSRMLKSVGIDVQD